MLSTVKISHMYNYIKLISQQRKFIRECSLEHAQKLKDFWGSFYEWKTEAFQQGTEWESLRHEDLQFHPEE